MIWCSLRMRLKHSWTYCTEYVELAGTLYCEDKHYWTRQWVKWRSGIAKHWWLRLSGTFFAWLWCVMFSLEIYCTATECFALLCASKLHCNEYWISWSRGVISIVSNLCKFLTPVMNQSDCKCLFRYSISIFLFHSYCNYSHRANCYLFRAACGQQRPASCNWMCSACNINTIQPSSCDWYVHTQTSCRLPVYCACSCSYDWTVSLNCSSSTRKQRYLCVKQWWICSENLLV